MLFVIKDGIELGLVYSLLAIGVFISFRVLDFADLSVEGTVTLGASIIASMLVKGQNLILATILATLAGFLAGSVTGILHTKLKIPAILSGIIVMTALYSINLKILGSSNIPLIRINTIFTPLNNLIKDPFLSRTITLLLIVSLVFLVLYLLFGTEIGMSIRASGMNKDMAGAQGINTNLMIILGLGISNAIIALGGTLISQYNGNATLNMGRGTIVVGLASIIVGETVLGKKTFKRWLLAIILGSIVYQTLFGFAIEIGLDTQLLQLVQALLVAIILAIPVIKNKFINKESLAYDKVK